MSWYLPNPKDVNDRELMKKWWLEPSNKSSRATISSYLRTFGGVEMIPQDYVSNASKLL